MSEVSRKPVLTVRGRDYIMSVWCRGNSAVFSVSKRGSNGFERLDRFTVPLDYFLLKVLEDEGTREVARKCLWMLDATVAVPGEEEDTGVKEM